MCKSSARKSGSHLLSNIDEEAKPIIPLLGRDVSIIIQAGKIQISLTLDFILHHKWKKTHKQPSLWLFLNIVFYFLFSASELNENSNEDKLKHYNFYLTNILIIFFTYFDTTMAMIQFSFFQIAFADRVLLLLQLSANYD